MLEAGIVLHLAGSGRLILQSKTDLKPGTILYDEKGRKVARVMETFGPVKSPYVSAVPLTDRVQRTFGHPVYLKKGG